MREKSTEQPELEEGGGGGGGTLSKPQTEPFGYYLYISFSLKKHQNTKRKKPSTNLGLDSLTEVPLVLPDHLTGFEGPRLT